MYCLPVFRTTRPASPVPTSSSAHKIADVADAYSLSSSFGGVLYLLVRMVGRFKSGTAAVLDSPIAWKPRGDERSGAGGGYGGGVQEVPVGVRKGGDGA